MNTDIEREAREAALLSTPMGTRYDEDLCCYDNDSLRDEFVLGYLAAATLREKEIEKLRALLEKLQKDAALYAEYVRRNPPVGMRDETEREIATLRARVEGLEKIASLADSIAHEFEVAVESRNPVCGMSVPPSGDFISCARLPSAVGRMRWWAREIRKAQPITVPEAKDNAPQQGV